MQEDVVLKAEFNPAVRIYILLYVFCVLCSTIFLIPLALIWLCGLGQWYSRHYFHKLECVLSKKDLRFKKGIILQIEKTIPLENIQDLSFIEGPLLRKLHLCILKVETAGSSAHNAHQMSLLGIKDAPAFRAKVLELRSLLKESHGASNASDTELLGEIKNSLHRIEELLKQKNIQ
ncbi:MAG: PH domain-containing protein [Bacteroidia bacterium]